MYLFFSSWSQIREGWRECEVSAAEILFNFYSHPSAYIPMTLLKVFSYWQMWQCSVINHEQKLWPLTQLTWFPTIGFLLLCICYHGTSTTKNSSSATINALVSANTTEAQWSLCFFQIYIKLITSCPIFIAIRSSKIHYELRLKIIIIIILQFKRSPFR